MAQGGIESSAPVKNHHAFKNPTGLGPKRELTLTFVSGTVPPVQMNVACDTELHKNFHNKRANFFGEFFFPQRAFSSSRQYSFGLQELRSGTPATSAELQRQVDLRIWSLEVVPWNSVFKLFLEIQREQ